MARPVSRDTITNLPTNTHSGAFNVTTTETATLNRSVAEGNRYVVNVTLELDAGSSMTPRFVAAELTYNAPSFKQTY